MSSTKKRSPLGTDVSTARREGRARRHYRLRKKVSGTPERPRLVVNRSSRHIHAQIIDDLAGHTLATGVVPYPPGIPLMMPGENAGPAGGALIGYLRALEAFDDRFPGFGHDTHGVEIEDGIYSVLVVRR